MKAEPSIFDEQNPDADAEGLAELDAGQSISNAAMKRWLLSWGTPNELPPPEIGD
jgi:predicted transcriptional regulator